MTCSREKMEKRSTLAAPRTSILHRERRALNFFRYGKYTAGRLDATSFCFSFPDSAAVCTYLTRSLSPKKYDWSRATPDETERLDTHTETRGLRTPFARASTHARPGIHVRICIWKKKEKKKEERPRVNTASPVRAAGHCAYERRFVSRTYPVFLSSWTCIPSVIFEYSR